MKNMQKHRCCWAVSGNMMDLPSVGDVHMKIGFCFKMSHIPDKIERHDADTSVRFYESACALYTMSD